MLNNVGRLNKFGVKISIKYECRKQTDAVADWLAKAV